MLKHIDHKDRQFTVFQRENPGQLWYDWITTSITYLTPQDLEAIQEKAGYHPAGYGQFDVKVTPYKGEYIYSWQSAKHCD